MSNEVQEFKQLASYGRITSLLVLLEYTNRGVSFISQMLIAMFRAHGINTKTNKIVLQSSARE